MRRTYLVVPHLIFTFMLAFGSRADAQAAGTPTPMSNADVIALVHAGLSDDLVIAKIEAAPSTSFDTSVGGLSALKNAGVPTPVIRTMIEPPAAASGAPRSAVAAGNPDDPMTPHSPGIYVLAKGADGQVHLTRLQGEHPRAAKNSGMFLHAVTQGLAASKSQQVLDGGTAAIELTEQKPVFYAYIPQDSTSFSGGMSVNDLVLTKLESKGDSRLWTYAARGVFGGSSEVGSDQKDRQGFTGEQVGSGIYKLTPAGDLASGQYAFKYAYTFFDFGVQPQS
ncbi:hypothetical protein [Acidipila sp. EB88]|uniref:hypothetical protein n=1 Tax=Acidipila sp. EB88 TaxID=2305226 RepID=UPI000F5F70A7|nr:hypothetical protein [Acidipila sp. EB88]RRA47884.1 hypothetical protein D1Y84_05815 [Acidipila sp. EB88]